VAGIVLLLIHFSPTVAGYAIAQPVIVAFLAELEYYHLRRIAC